jgi:2'-deoxynucleoside 5'-phosphate N-hydrolase
MKIYFAGSIRGGRNDQALYAEIVVMLGEYGKVLTEHVGDKNISIMGEGDLTRKIHDRDIDWLKSADVVVAEVTTASLGVGYEIAKAEEMGKKILCIYREIEGKSISAMISGSDKLVLKKYKSVKDIKNIFEEFCHKSNISLK